MSTRCARRRLPYEVFRYVHLLLYVAIGLALVHQALEGTSFDAPLANAYWWTMWVLVIGSLLVFRAVVPVRRNLRHRFRVADVVPESEDVVSVHVTGRDLDRFPARAGQFCIWRFPGHFGWWQANPFSLSAAPDGQTLRLTAKAVGGDERRAAPGPRSGRASSSRGRTARSPRCSRARPRPCSSPEASASRRSGLFSRRSPARRS